MSDNLPPCLPPGKTYHAYFIYMCESQDSRVAFDIVRILEEQHGMRLCLRDRDFLPGLAIVDNIDLCLQKSFKIVILLSEKSLASEWVEHELNVAMYLHLSKDGGLQQQIIPLKLDACKLPPKIAFIHPLSIENVEKDIWMNKLYLSIVCTQGLEHLYGRGIKLDDCIPQQNGANGGHEMYSPQKNLCAIGTVLSAGTIVAKCFRAGDSYVITTATAARQLPGSMTRRRISGCVEFPRNDSTKQKEKFRLKSLKFIDDNLDIAVIKLERTLFRRFPERLQLPSESRSGTTDNFTDINESCEMGSPCAVDGDLIVHAMSLESGDGSTTVKAVKMEAFLNALSQSDSSHLLDKL
ncbi:uncharacterized protein [Argopecten irradians]|uniref:uncharacterized protein isoform X2 n=1 Tax=Argopecten irradians TaxID=31199 RepID=UPI0037134DD3